MVSIRILLIVLIAVGFIAAYFLGFLPLPRLPGLAAQLTVGKPQIKQVEEFIVSVNPIPAKVFPEKNVSLAVDLTNSGNLTIYGPKFIITDSCFFKDKTELKSDGKLPKKLRPGESLTEELELTAMPGFKLREPKICTLRYQVSYNSTAKAIYSITAISDERYEELLRRGELEEEVPLAYSKLKTPVDISMSLSKTQPILPNIDFYLRVKFTNVGKGIVEGFKLEQNKVEIKYPIEFLNLEGCDQGFGDEDVNSVITGSAIKFLAGETPRITCEFSPKDIEFQKSGYFKVNVTYKYKVRDSINIKVKPR